MAEHSLSKRRLFLGLIAVGIPSLALIGLGVGLILQESQLEDSRRTEKFEDTFVSFSASLEQTAGRLRNETAFRILEHGWITRGIEFDSAIVLLGSVNRGELRLPWQLNGAVELFNRKIHSGQFGRALLRAERLEFTNGATEQAVRAYRTIISSTQDTLQRAYTRLSLARVLEKSNLEEEADAIRLEVLELPAHFSDDFGVPLFLYAAQQIVQNILYVDSVKEVLLSHARFPLHFSPQAAYLYRAIHDSLRAKSSALTEYSRRQQLAEIGEYAQKTLWSIRLQEDFRTVYPRLVFQAGEHGYGLYANDTWLLSISADTSDSSGADSSGADSSGVNPPGADSSRANSSDNGGVLVVFDAETMVRKTLDESSLSASGYNVQVLSSESSPPNRWLGPPFSRIYAQLIALETTAEQQGFMNRISFIILAMALIIGLMSLGFYLWWRDTRRELITAKLRSDFVSSVSHELKTPLTSIRMFAETLRF